MHQRLTSLRILEPEHQLGEIAEESQASMIADSLIRYQRLHTLEISLDSIVREPYAIEALIQSLAGGLLYLRSFTVRIPNEEAFERIFKVLIKKRENLKQFTFLAKQDDL